jgi:transcriptional antiterminator NusG
MDPRPWHVLHVLSNFEKRVDRHLTVRSIEHYIPFYSERVKWTDRTVITERPLFPGYVFVRFSPQDKVAVISVPGVLRDLGDEERNMVDSKELDQIRAGLASGLPLRPHRSLMVGTRVSVREGIFAGAEGVVAELRQQCKVVLTLSGTRQSFSLEVGADTLEVIKKPVAALSLRQAGLTAARQLSNTGSPVSLGR